MQVPAAEVKEETNPTQPLRRGYPVLGGRYTTRGLGRAVRTALPRLVFLLGIVLIVHVLAYVADTFAPDGNTRFLQFDRRHVSAILAAPEKIEALALGNSHTGSLNMDALGFANGYRFARADGDMFEVNYYLKYFTPRLTNLDIVLIPVSYFSFLGENTSSAEVEIRRVHMYASLPSWTFLPGDLEPLLVGKSHTYFPVARLVREDNWEGVFYALLGREPEVKGFIEVAPGDCSFLTTEELAASADNRVTKYMRLTGEMTAAHPGLAEDVYMSMAETARYLQRRGVRLVLYTPPYWQGYNEQYQARDPQSIALMRSSVTRLQQELGVEYYDFAHDPQFTSDATLFKDSDHLNSCGAEQFSRKLNGVISQRQAVGP